MKVYRPDHPPGTVLASQTLTITLIVLGILVWPGRRRLCRIYEHVALPKVGKKPEELSPRPSNHFPPSWFAPCPAGDGHIMHFANATLSLICHANHNTRQLLNICNYLCTCVVHHWCRRLSWVVQEACRDLSTALYPRLNPSTILPSLPSILQFVPADNTHHLLSDLARLPWTGLDQLSIDHFRQ